MEYNVRFAQKELKHYDLLCSEFDICFDKEEFVLRNDLFIVEACVNSELAAVSIFRLRSISSAQKIIRLFYTVVKKEYRGHGINKSIKSFVENYAIQEDVSKILANVRESNLPSRKSLLSSGFKEDSSCDLYYKNGERKIRFFKETKFKE